MAKEIDLSRMLDEPRCAIHVASKEQADTIVHNARIQFPNRVKNWSYDNNIWGVYEENTAFTLFYEGEDSPSNMSYADVPWFLEHGYVVVEFDELVKESADITESDQSIGILIGDNYG